MIILSCIFYFILCLVTVEFEEVYKIVEEYSEEGKVDLICAITEGVLTIPIQIKYVSELKLS